MRWLNGIVNYIKAYEEEAAFWILSSSVLITMFVMIMLTLTTK
jgi:hypothetical protein